MNEINNFIEQGCIKLVHSDIVDTFIILGKISILNTVKAYYY